MDSSRGMYSGVGRKRNNYMIDIKKPNEGREGGECGGLDGCLLHCFCW